MSQEKVDKYKEYKKNRKEIIEKEQKAKKRSKLIGTVIGAAVGIGLAAALVFTGVNTIKAKKEARPIYDRDGYVLSDVAGILETEAESTEAESTAAESQPEQQESTAAD